MLSPLQNGAIRSLLFAGALGLGIPACQRPGGIGTAQLHDPWQVQSIPPLHRPTSASTIQIREISSGADPLLVRAYSFLEGLAHAAAFHEAYAGLIESESLENIRGYMTPGASTYDRTYRWRVFVNPRTQDIEGLSATYQISLPDGRTVTVVDYHTPSERPIPGQLNATFPACPISENNFCMVEVSSRTARGYTYYTQQGFGETRLGDHYHHIAGPSPEHAVLLVLSRQGGTVPLEGILTAYATALGSDVARSRLADNLREPNH